MQVLIEENHHVLTRLRYKLQGVEKCCRVLQGVELRCRVHGVAWCCSVLQCVVVCCIGMNSSLCCSILQCLVVQSVVNRLDQVSALL